MFVTLLLIATLQGVMAQNNSDSLTRKQKITRKSILLGTAVAYTGGSFLFLDQLWYKQYATSNFHFYNDNLQWCQMDKVGHAYSAYTSANLIWQALEWAGFEAKPHQANIGHLTSNAMQWAGFTRKQSILIGEIYGLLYLSSVEILDGFSKGWGFSWGDELADIGGGLIFSLQQYYWKEQRFRLKFSYHETAYPAYRPELLGQGFAEKIIKDYNGQTYWLSANLASFLKKESKFPKWLSLSLGYSATGMISGKSNEIINNVDRTISFTPGNSQTSEIINADGSIQYFTRYRRFFFSLDIDLSKIKTRSKVLKGIFGVLNCFKVPFPALEWNHVKGFSVHPFYF